MPKICIAFDRLRLEEKMLQKEAAGLGYAVSMLDAKSVRLDTESARGDYDLGDVVMGRCISYFRGLHLAAALEFLDVAVCNTFAVAQGCGNKMLMTMMLKKHNVPTPRTYFAFSKDSAIQQIESAGYPLVIKPVIGSWGRGVMPVRDRDTMDAIIETREISDTSYDRIYYLQELVRRQSRDIRVIAIGGRAIAAMYRYSKDGAFKTNIALGATPELCEITPEIEELAAASSDAVGGGILGIDMMEDQKDGLLVHEVNNTVEFRGLAGVAGANIPKEIVEFVARHVRK